MATISQSEIAAVYTTLIAAKHDELMSIRATGFLRSMFIDNITKVRYPAYDVRRGSEKVAIDVIRGHQGIRTQITRATQKITDPFYFKLYFDATELDCYWRLFGSPSISENIMTEFVDGIAVHNKANQDMIDRAYELFCASILEFGTCTSLSDGSVINFNRKAGSMVAKTVSNYWTDANVDPYADFGLGGDFIRKNGKYMGGTFNATFGSDAFSAFMNNTVVKGRNDLKMWKLDDIIAPDQKIDGQTYHGTVSAGAYTIHIWQYPQFYEAPNGTLTPYINPKKVILTPAKTEFQTIYAATPQLVTPGATTLSLVSGKNILSSAIDPIGKTHKFFVESCGLPVPLAIDTIYTLQPIA